MTWQTILHWLYEFMDPKALVEDRFHAFLFGVVILGLWKKAKGMTQGRQKSVWTAGVAVLALFLVVSIIAGLGSNRADTGTKMRAVIGPTIASKINNSDSDTSIVLILRLVNSGDPSIAWNWKLTTILPSGNTFTATASPSAIEGQLEGRDGKKVDIYQTNYLPSVLFSKPLAHGDGIEGWAQFSFKGLPVTSVQIGTRFKLEIDDAFGHRVETETAWSGPVQSY